MTGMEEAKLLEDAKNGVAPSSEPELIVDELKCTNPRCITSTEQELQHAFRLMDAEHGIYRCIYCDSKAKR